MKLLAIAFFVWLLWKATNAWKTRSRGPTTLGVDTWVGNQYSTEEPPFVEDPIKRTVLLTVGITAVILGSLFLSMVI